MICYKDIIKDENPALRKKSKEVKLPLSKEDKELLLAMHQYLITGYDEKKAKESDIRPGVGLAAPQLNVLKKMFVIVAFDERDQLFDFGLINPKIVSQSVEKCYLRSGEGCLSVPETHEGYVHRAKRIKATFDLYDFKKDKIYHLENFRLKGYIAVIFQHEYDHLSGILFYDRINKENPFFVPENSHPVKFDFEKEEEKRKENQP